MKTLKVEVFQSDEAYYSWLDARNAGLRVSKYTPIIVPEDDCTTAHIIVKCKRLDTAIKHAKEAFADYSDVVEALEELERKRAEDKHVTGISDRYNTISTCYNGIDGEYSFYIVVEARDEVAEASEESNTEEAESESETDTESGEEATTKLAERYTSKEGFSYAIITERKDGKFFVMTNCGEDGDKYRQWKIFDTYEEAHDYLRDAGYFMLKKIIEVDSNTGEGEKCDGEIETDDEAPVKVFSSFDEYNSYFDEIPFRRVPLLVHKGDALLVDAVIRADDLDTAIRRTCEIYADYPSVLKAIEKATAGDDRTKYTDENIKWRVYCSDLLSYKRYRICLDVAEEPEEAQKSDDAHETNARLEIVKLKNAKFGTPRLYKSVTGYAFYDAKKGGYWAYSAHRDKHGILTPYIPCGGREALEKILSDGGFTSFEGMEVVKPLE